MVSMVKKGQTKWQYLFHTVLNNPMNIKQPPKRKTTNEVKDKGGGVRGRFDRGQRFIGCFKCILVIILTLNLWRVTLQSEAHCKW